MPDVKQTITDFYRVAQERDFSRDFQFRVLNIQNADGSVVVSEDDLVYARGGTIPGREISENTVSYMGLDFRVPGSVKYAGSYDIEFLCDTSDTLRNLMLTWTRDTFDDATSTGNYFIAKETSIVDLVQLDTQLERVAQYTLVGVYPKQVGDITYTLDGTGAPVNFSMTLGYHYIRSETY